MATYTLDQYGPYQYVLNGSIKYLSDTTGIVTVNAGGLVEEEGGGVFPQQNDSIVYDEYADSFFMFPYTATI